MQTTEDADLVVDGLAIVERDGFYEEGEMEGAITPPDLDADDADEESVAIGGTWPGEVRQRLVPTHPQHATQNITCGGCGLGSGWIYPCETIRSWRLFGGAVAAVPMQFHKQLRPNTTIDHCTP